MNVLHCYIPYNNNTIKTTMSNFINWDSVQESNRGGAKTPKTHGKIIYRDGTTDKSASYRIIFYRNCPDEIMKSDHITPGIGGSDFFITTKDIPNVAKFKVNKKPSKSKKSYRDVYGKDFARKAIKTTTGIDPSGDVSITFNLKQVNGKTFKLTDIEIE